MPNMNNRHDYVEAFGAIESPIDIRDYRIDVSCAVNYPDEFQLKMVRIKNQGRVSSCVAHAVSEVIEYFNKEQNHAWHPMSINYIYGNRRNSTYKGEGMCIRDALGAACEYGDVQMVLMPGNSEVPECIKNFEEKADKLKSDGMKSRFTSYFRLMNESEIKTSLIKNGPVIFSIKWYKDITLDKDYVISSKCNDKDSQGGHCMVIYGWNKKGWLVLNSWGAMWGDGGKCIIPFDFPLKEAWGVVDTYIEDDKTIIKPFNKTFSRFFAKILNAILNFFAKIKKFFRRIFKK